MTPQPCRRPLAVAPRRSLFRISLRAGLVLTLLATAARAVEIAGVEAAALDQPRINAYISTTANGSPLTASDAGVDSFNIEAFYDTGASGVLLSTNTAALLGLQPSTYNGQEVLYSDVGVAGSDNFYVSNPVYISLADYHPSRDIDNPSTYSSVYTNHFGPIRTQIGPANGEPDPALGDLDVFGTPTMAGKVVVMDPKPVNSFLDTMRTYVYAPGTAFNPSSPTNPGIPNVDKHVKLSYVNFDRFTQTTPAGAPGPTLRNNPFIGPNPFVAPGTDTTPPVTISFNGASVNGSFLLDTGAAASIISKSKAGALGVSYDPNTVGTDNPVLMYNGHAISDQFQLTIGGIGGSKVVSGFYLSSLLLRTQEGNPNDANDPNHLKFTDAPVLVSDISVANPNVPADTYTLDGIFGMNYLVASAQIAGTDENGFPLIGNLARGKFDWITFDEPNGVLGLKVAAPAPQNEVTWLGNFSDARNNYWDTESENWIVDGTFGPYTNGDHVTFGDDTLTTNIRLREIVAPGGVTFDNNVDSDGYGTDYDLTGSDIGDGRGTIGHISGFGGLIKRGDADLRIHTPNDYTGATVVEAGRIIFFAPQNVGPLSVNVGAEVLFATSDKQRFESISVRGLVTATSGSLFVTKALAVDAGGSFQLSDARMVIGDSDGSATDARATAVDLRDTLASGGLVSDKVAANVRLAIGYIAAGTKFGTLPAVWNGESVDAGQVLVAVTRRGDANLDFTVGFADLIALAQHYNQPNQVWSSGDFNYDGKVNFTDLVALAQNYNTSGTASLTAAGLDSSFVADWALAQSLVPEPTLIGCLSPMLILATRRRRAGRA